MLPSRLLCAQDSAAVAEPVTAPIVVHASISTAETSTNQFLAGFITTATRLEGAKFIACVGAASKTRPDLAPKVVVCAFNLARLNFHPLRGQLSLSLIDQVIIAAVAAAPEKAADIVKAAISSEPYAQNTIIAAAIAAAPEEETEIYAVSSQVSPMSMFAFATITVVNPVNDGGLGPVNSPEQPPAGP